MIKNLKKFPRYLLMEAILGVLSTFILMVLTFNFDGSKGLVHLIEGYNDQLQKANYWNITILLIIGLVAFGLSYFFNFRSKNDLKWLAQNLFDVAINLLRVSGGLLISFVFLHFCVSGLSYKLISFALIGGLGLSESAIGTMMKDHFMSQSNRPLK